jgi:hypothetical protein
MATGEEESESLGQLLSRASLVSGANPCSTYDVKKAEQQLGYFPISRDTSSEAWKYFARLLKGNYQALWSLNVSTIQVLESLPLPQLQTLFGFSTLGLTEALHALLTAELETSGWYNFPPPSPPPPRQLYPIDPKNHPLPAGVNITVRYIDEKNSGSHFTN